MSQLDCHLQMHFRRARAHVVRERQGATPVLGRLSVPSSAASSGCASHTKSAAPGILVMVFTSFSVEPLRILRRADTRRQRIAGIDRHVHHTAALHAIARPQRPVGKDVALT